MDSYNDQNSNINEDTAKNYEHSQNQQYSRPAPNIPPVRQMPQRKRDNGCLMAVIFTLGFFAIFIIGGVLLFNSGAKVATKFLDSAAVTMSNSKREKPFYEEVLTGEDSNVRIAVIPITGPIFGTGNIYYGAGTLHEVSYQLNLAANDDTIKAVILHIDSPGGGLSASDIIYNQVKKIKDKGKKVVVYVGQLCASGGYYIAAPADYIVASPTALIGSFGVIMQHVEVTGLLEKLGVVVDPLKSTDSKDIGSPFKKMTKEEKEYFNKLLTTFHNRFVNIIATGRKLEKSQIEKLADGKVYIAKEALAYGLIDEVGYFESSLDEAKKACTVDYPEVILYKRPFSLSSLFGAQTHSAIPNINDFLNENSGTKINMIYRGVRSNTK